MIIGSGMMARALAPVLADNHDVIAIAAGVSNSSETQPSAFARERELILPLLERRELLIYFSSCALADERSLKSPYYQHKKAMEALVGQAANHTILRLPQVIGHTENTNTFFGHFAKRLLAGETVTLWRGAQRFIIDADDVAYLCGQLVARGAFRNTTVNLSCPEPYTVNELVSLLAEILGVELHIRFVDRDDSYALDLGPCIAFNQSLDTSVNFENHYARRVIEKYFGPS